MALLLLVALVGAGVIFLPRVVYPPLTNEQLQYIDDTVVRLQLKSARSALEIEFRWQLIAMVAIFLTAGVVGFRMWLKK
ncbi:hypothetical protein DI270_003060 [Microbispora triticiradicis]|uniref:Uncharacterized protein n=3 Tax=Microbispora TaxID=2005 RepID=A0ABY3LSU8_9ACTN|nr:MULTISPECIES: hypothetical protein [Microbispora]RGA06477.1 hypothetical protein DI270_003060 [Microbispora triticiradicis]TLP62478.1 hypothetical protein FED44_11105 [Microbispora fusca]TYB52015.1 hypothetical protein FXF59_25615 [Microbispora tritici]GLW22267.1 hypothetical protein Mame01_23100 [Microbispora amethystogenes]